MLQREYAYCKLLSEVGTLFRTGNLIPCHLHPNLSNVQKKISQLIAKRRSRFDGISGKLYYRFILKGDEDVLCELEGEWDCVPLQTEWKLENCYNSGGRDGSQQQSTKQSAINQNIEAKSCKAGNAT